jgi:hypothetical protein
MAILATAAGLTAGLWMLPVLMGMMGYMRYDDVNPESHIRSRRALDNE